MGSFTQQLDRYFLMIKGIGTNDLHTSIKWQNSTLLLQISESIVHGVTG